MKTNIFTLLAIGAAALGAASCSEHWTPPMSEEGSVELESFVIDPSADLDALVVKDAASRATTDISDYIVTITDLSGAQAPQTWRYAEKPEIVTLPVGIYRIDAVSHQVQKAAWEEPLFVGSKDFEITNGAITRVGVVTASFASLKVTVEFDDELRAVLGNDVTVTIVANDEGSLVFTPSETRAGYFEVLEGSNTMVAHFEGSVNGVMTSYDTPFINIAAGQHRILSYKAKPAPVPSDPTGTITTPGVTIDATVTVEEIGASVGVEEDVVNNPQRPWGDEETGDPDPGPGPDQPGGDDTEEAISFTPKDSPKLSLDNENTASADFGNAIVQIHAEAGIKNLWVTIESSSAFFMSALADMELDVPFDLAYPTDTQEYYLRELTIPCCEQVIGLKDVDFDITQFISMLVPFSGDHNFKLEVTDNDNKVKSMTLRFKS